MMVDRDQNKQRKKKGKKKEKEGVMYKPSQQCPDATQCQCIRVMHHACLVQDQFNAASGNQNLAKYQS